jgi:hypothetical protein
MKTPFDSMPRILSGVKRSRRSAALRAGGEFRRGERLRTQLQAEK